MYKNEMSKLPDMSVIQVMRQHYIPARYVFLRERNTFIFVCSEFIMQSPIYWNSA